MKILITGAKGFVGKNLVASLKNIRDGKDRVHPIKGLEHPEDLTIYEYDIDSTLEGRVSAGRDKPPDRGYYFRCQSGLQ